MHWILQSGFESERGVGDLLDFLKRAAIPHSLHKIIPFIQALEPDANPEGNVIVFGTYGMRHLAKRKGWVPGSFDLADITYGRHVAHWGAHMLNSDAVFCTFAEAPSHVEADPVFMRPVVDSKFFSGKVLTLRELLPWHHSVVNLKEEDGSSLNADTMVLIAKLKPIQREYRIWVVDSRVVTASLYKQGGKPLFSSGVDSDVLQFAEARAREWAPARAYVMDVAMTEKGFRIVETNTFNSAGLYCADVCKLVGAIESMSF